MSAKEMFEKLGYECYENVRSIHYIANCDMDEDYISIGFGLLSHTFYAQHNCNPNDITIDEFKAIQQQLKELGWLEEETCENLSEYDSMDEFQCSNCGLTLVEHKEYLVGEDEDEEYYFNYRPKYCPNCGRKIVEENEK